MFKLHKIVNNVKKVCSNNITAFFLTKNEKIYQNEELIFEGQNISDIRICINDFYTFGDSKYSYLGDFRNKHIRPIDFMFSSECIWREGAIINENYRYDFSDGKIKADYYIIDFNTKQKRLLFRDLEGIINSLFNDNKKAIHLYRSTLKSLSLLTGEYEWEVDLSEYGEIRTVLAAVQDNLWVLVNDYKNNRHSLLCLDVTSGRIMQVLGEGLRLSDAHVKYIEEKQTLLSFKSSISAVPSPSTLIEIDATTGQVLRNITVESMLAPNLKVGLWQYHNNKLFFTANTTMMTTTHIGVLDYDTLQLLWYTEVPDRKGLLKDLQVSEDKIYVLDQVGTLHIFEKESSIE